MTLSLSCFNDIRQNPLCNYDDVRYESFADVRALNKFNVFYLNLFTIFSTTCFTLFASFFSVSSTFRFTSRFTTGFLFPIFSTSFSFSSYYFTC